jgi:CAAX protease family protein
VVHSLVPANPTDEAIGRNCPLKESEGTETTGAIEDNPCPAETAGPGRSWRDRSWLAIVEFLIVALIFYADYRGWIPFSKTPELLLLGWISLRVRGLRWRDVGLTRYRAWPVTIAIGIGLGLLAEGFQLLVTQPILSNLLGKEPDLELFRMLTGNIKMTALFIALSWTLAAFGEEMFWRGYLMNRVADVGGRTLWAWITSLVIVNIVFGFAHGYQGLTGLIEEGISGSLLALMYLRTGRNLCVPILAHGLGDTIDMILIFLGKFPGM